MDKNKLSHEKGQALVLIVLAVVALLAFVSLAIDGGQIYSQRRIAQNAADAAAYSGATQIAQAVKSMDNTDFDCNVALTTAVRTAAENAGIAKANENNYQILAASYADVNDLLYDNGNHEVKNHIGFYCNPGVSDPYVDVVVRVTKSVTTSFMQYVNPGVAINTVSSVVRVRPRVALGDGAALVALRNACGNGTSVNAPTPNPVAHWNGGITFDGGYQVYINGGGIQSNDCCNINGYSGDLEIIDGSFTCNGSINVNPTPHPVDPMPTHGDDHVFNFQPMINKVEGSCNSLPSTSFSNGSGALAGWKIYPPGRHSSINVQNNQQVLLQEGLHCILGTNDGIDVKGELKGTGVTIFIGPSAGSINISAGATVNLSPPPANCEYNDPAVHGCPPAYGGLLILYAPFDKLGGNPTEIFIGGNSSSSYTGSIIAPYNMVEIGGNPSMSNQPTPTPDGSGTPPGTMNFGAQIIADTILIHGTVNLTNNWDPNNGVLIPSFLNLQK